MGVGVYFKEIQIPLPPRTLTKRDDRLTWAAIGKQQLLIKLLSRWECEQNKLITLTYTMILEQSSDSHLPRGGAQTFKVLFSRRSLAFE